LFPGYLFVRLDLAKPWHPVLFAPGVFQLLSLNGIPSTCPDAAVQAVRNAVQAAEASGSGDTLWKPGQPCSLALGPLRGHSAVVLSVSRETATLALLLFGELRQVSAPVGWLMSRE
jgi:transcription antitermination factor NusG